MRAKPAIIDVDMNDIERLRERARAQLGLEDAILLERLVQTLVDLTAQIRRSGTTIASLRRLLGQTNSEKTADVLGRSSSTQPPADGARIGTDGDDGRDDDSDPGDDADLDVDGHDDDEDRRGESDTKKRRKGHGRIPAAAYQRASDVVVQHETLHAGDGCPECAHGRLYRLPEPAPIIRIFGQPPLAATCWDCERLRCGGCGHVFTARAPEEAQGPKYSESAASMIAMQRYGSGAPFNRIDRLQRNLQTPVPSSTQWEIVRDREPKLRPIYQELIQHAANGQVLHNDDTHMRILELMGKRRAALLSAGNLPDPERTGLFTTGIVASTAAGPIALFFTGRKHAGENLTALLAKRDRELAPPIQMCDGLDRNLPKDYPVVLSNCLAHGRRHIVDEVDNFPDACRHVLEELGKVFEHEATCRALGLTGQERLEFHQRESATVMNDLYVWLKAELDEKRVEPNSGLGQAYNYLLKRWDRLTLFLRIRDAPLENNICERALKMAIRHRNNSLFYRTLRGAHVGDLYMTLIYTAELHGENPFEYLIALMRHEAAVAEDPAAWLPWTYRATLATLDAAA